MVRTSILADPMHSCQSGFSRFSLLSSRHFIRSRRFVPLRLHTLVKMSMSRMASPLLLPLFDEPEEPPARLTSPRTRNTSPWVAFEKPRPRFKNPAKMRSVRLAASECGTEEHASNARESKIARTAFRPVTDGISTKAPPRRQRTSCSPESPPKKSLVSISLLSSSVRLANHAPPPQSPAAPTRGLLAKLRFHTR